MSHEQFEESIPLYVVGALERAERQTLEAHLLGGCTACRTALEEYRPVAAKLPFALPRLAAPPGLKTKLMAAIAQPAPLREPSASSPHASREPIRLQPERTSGRPSSWAWLSHPGLAAASLVLLVLAGWYIHSIRSQLDIALADRQKAEIGLQETVERLTSIQKMVTEQEQAVTALRGEVTERSAGLGEIQAALATREAELDELRTQVTVREREVATLRTALAQRDEMLTFLRSPNVKVISLSGSERAKSAGAFLLYDADSKKAFFYSFNMPALPAGKIYQLWAIVDKPISAGIFSTDAGQKGRLIVRTVPEFSHIKKFAVSVEPEGGRPQPTGDIYLAGQL
jgi:anti-sigma-K factor RskA